MKNVRRLMPIIMMVLVFVSVIVLATACNNASYTVTVTSEHGTYQLKDGDKAIESGAQVEAGTELTFTVTAADKYLVKNVKVNDVVINATEGKYAITVNADTTIVVEYEKVKYAVTVTSDHGTYELKNGDAAVASGSQVDVDSELTLTVTPEQHYVVKSVKVNGSEIQAAEGKYTVSVTAATEVVIEYDRAKYVVNVTSEHGTYELKNGEDMVESGTEVDPETTLILMVTPAEKYLVKSVKVNGNEVTIEEDKYTISVIAATEIVIEYEKINYGVTVTMDHGTYELKNGDSIVTSGSKVDVDSELILTVTPADHYTVTRVQVNGSPVEAVEDKYTFTVTEETTVVIECESLKYAVTVACDQGIYELKNGDDTVENGAEFEYGTQLTFTVTAKENFTVKSVKVNGVEATETDGVYNIEVSDETEIVVEFDASMPDEFDGNWSDGEITLDIAEGVITYDEVALTLNYEVKEGITVYSIEIDETKYEISWYKEVGKILMLKGEETAKYFGKTTEQVTLEQEYTGTWTAANRSTLVIDGNNVTFNDEEVKVLVFHEFATTRGAGEFIQEINFNSYYFVAAGTVYEMVYIKADPGDDDHAPIPAYVLVNDEITFNGLFHFEDEYIDTWNNLEDDSVMIIKRNDGKADTLTIDGAELTVIVTEEGNMIVWNNKNYSLAMYPGNENMIQLTTSEYNDAGIPISFTNIYFIRQGTSAPKVEKATLLDTIWTCNGHADIKISAEGQITYGEDILILLSYMAPDYNLYNSKLGQFTLTYGVSYLQFFGGTGDAYIGVPLTYEKQGSQQVGGKFADYVGDYAGSSSDGTPHTVKVEGEKITVDDGAYTFTADMVEGAAGHYNLTFYDESSFMDVTLNIDFEGETVTFETYGMVAGLDFTATKGGTVGPGPVGPQAPTDFSKWVGDFSNADGHRVKVEADKITIDGGQPMTFAEFTYLGDNKFSGVWTGADWSSHTITVTFENESRLTVSSNEEGVEGYPFTVSTLAF